MINHFRAEMPRPLVGIGHSFGGNSITNLAIFHPRLFSTIVLLDPVMAKAASTAGGLQYTPAASSVHRRDLWPSREAAAASFKKSPFYQAWDPRVFGAWVEYGLRLTPTLLYPNSSGEATLATTKHQEVFTFFRPSWNAYDSTGKKLVSPELVPDLDVKLQEQGYPTYPVYRSEGPSTIERLPNLRPSTLYVFGEASGVSIPEWRKEKMDLTGTGAGGSGGAAAGRVKEICLAGAGHLFPMETPDVSAEHAATWIGQELKRYRKEQAEYEEWVKKNSAEKITLEAKWFEIFPKQVRGAPKSPPVDAKAKI
jgi:pimeloyl-ACP methyl ester carboxylesterase